MRHHTAAMTGRWRKIALGGPLVLLGLAVAGLRDGRAQMRYSGGFTPMRHVREKVAPQPASPQTASPAEPKTPLSYFPDNDFAYPFYNPAGVAKRPLPSAETPLPYGISPTSLPWHQPGFADYNELLRVPQDITPGEAKKYHLVTITLPQAPAEERSVAVLIAHLPEHGVLWVEGTRTRSTGRTRCFQSPPLMPGRKYNYRVRAAWIEDGRWVNQSCTVPVQAGVIQALFLRPAPSSSPAQSVNQGGLR